MSMRVIQIIVGALLVGTTAACGGAWPMTQIDCERTFEAKDEASLAEVLSGAVRGDCVQPAKGEYAGSFVIPAGVALSGSMRNPPVFLGGEAGEPALVLEGGEGSLLANVEIASTQGHGLVILGGPARLQQSRLSAPRGLALVLRCFESGCDNQRVEVFENEIHDSLNGIVISGVNAVLEDNDLHDFDGVSIEAGIGLAVTGGATLNAHGIKVTGAGEVAVLVDGAQTVSTFNDLTVVENRGRGLWAQGLRGSNESPALTIGGPATIFANNTIVGIGSIDSVGIVVGTCIVLDTSPVEIPTQAGLRPVGDGIGLFGNTSEVSLGEGLLLRGNARAGLMVDNGGTSIVVGTAIVEPGTSGFGVVIQRTTNTVELDPSITADDPGEVLGVAAAPLNVPGV